MAASNASVSGGSVRQLGGDALPTDSSRASEHREEPDALPTDSSRASEHREEPDALPTDSSRASEKVSTAGPVKPGSLPAWRHRRSRSSVVSDILSYPHPSFPSPEAPSVETVRLAKLQLVDIICSANEYVRAVRRIAAAPHENYRFTLYRVDKVGTPMLAKNLSIYSLVNHETVWPELLDRVYQALGPVGSAYGNITVSREQDCAAIRLIWNEGDMPY